MSGVLLMESPPRMSLIKSVKARRCLKRTVDRVIAIAAVSFRTVKKVMGLKIYLCCFWQPLQLN